jgi:oxygen-independent coproporphyrinogen-3 oxidase
VARLAGGDSPGQGREILTDGERHTEDVMLRLRLASGLPLDALEEAGRAAAARALGAGLLQSGAFAGRTAVLTERGRLLADAVIRDLLP